MQPDIPATSRALDALKSQIEVAQGLAPFRPMSEEEKAAFAQKHPGAHFVVGDFEIRCLSPDKYNL